MTSQERDDLRCDILLFITVPTEEKKLRQVSKELGFPFELRTDDSLGEYYFMGKVGQTRVNAVLTKIGPFSHGGCASRAINFRIATGATGIIQLGMAFGVDRVLQSYGDVLVSTSLIPYDLREVRAVGVRRESIPREIEDQFDDLGQGDGSESALSRSPLSAPERPISMADPPYHVDYRHAIRHRSKESLVGMFIAERDRGRYEHRIHFGGMLSGGARIFSRRFLGELIRGVPPAEDGIIGGEMEGVGLLSVSPIDDPIWIVVKGISDFADERRDEDIKRTRPLACENSVRFVLAAIANANA